MTPKMLVGIVFLLSLKSLASQLLMTRSAVASTLGGIRRFWILNPSMKYILSVVEGLRTGLELQNHRITRSALANRFGGMVRPICLAVFKLMINSNFVGCSTGRFSGLVPLRIRSTYQAPRCPSRYSSGSYDNKPPCSAAQPDRGSFFSTATVAIVLHGSVNSPLPIIKMPSVLFLERESTASVAALADLIGFSVGIKPSFGAVLHDIQY